MGLKKACEKKKKKKKRYRSLKFGNHCLNRLLKGNKLNLPWSISSAFVLVQTFDIQCGPEIESNTNSVTRTA